MSAPRPLSKTVFINRYFWPDHSATAQMLSDVAFDLAGRGRTVTVICSRYGYDGGDTRFAKREEHSGVTIRRVATTGFGRGSLPGRLIDYLSFYISALFAAFAVLRRGDILVVKTDPPLLSAPMAVVAWMRGAKLINWLQDLFPETAKALGVSGVSGPIAALLRGMRNWSLRRAKANVVIGQRMADHVAAQGVERTKIIKIENWTDDWDAPTSLESVAQLRSEWGFAPDDFIISYSGNLGRAHDYRTILAAAELLAQRGETHIRFLFIGDGFHYDALKREAEGLGEAIRFQPYQLRERLNLSMSVADIHWISLRPEAEGLIVPSKFYGAAASGRPIVFIGDAEGEIAQLLAKHECGVTVAQGDAEALADVLSALSRDQKRCAVMGARARAYAQSEAARQGRLDQWAALTAP